MEADMMKITGLDELSRELTEAQTALESIDGELGSVNFNPHDPASIEAAIQDVEAMIDSRLGAYSSNQFIGPMAEEMKEQYRQGIIDRAAEARLEGNAE
jgi:hypothetical protein